MAGLRFELLSRLALCERHPQCHQQAAGGITEFAAHYESLNDVEARRILDEWLAYESGLVKLRARNTKRVAKVLPGTKLAPYFQVENRLDAIGNLTTASRTARRPLR